MYGQSNFKNDLEMLARRKLVELADFSIYITPPLKAKIRDLQDELLELRQSNTFTEDKGITLVREIDQVNKSIAKLTHDGAEEDRKRKIRKPILKRNKKLIKTKK